ncbi:MAG: oligosaccharide flippase family protein [Giesbergeria sp.]|nr:oligosaccharide flippase family protein [Giesbergeria sp.]
MHMGKSNPKFIFIKGALWSLGTRWAIKLAGFLNTVIMARLLMPSDYGIVAMSMLVVEATHTFTDVGAETAVLRIEKPTRDEVDSAWTLRLFQNIFVGLFVVAIAPLAAGYFKEPRVEPVLFVFAACMCIYGLTNIGLTLAHKEFNFSVFFRVSVYSKVLSVLTTLVAGVILKDYRALVIGIASGYISGAVLSYVMHPYRPKINKTKIKEIWEITKWLMLTSMGGFLLRRSDEIIASKIAVARDYGIYHVGADLGRLPVSEMGPVMMRAFLPVLSSMQGDMKRTNAAVLKTLSAINVITIPVGLGISAIAVPLTEMVLGEKWLEAVPFVAIYAVVAAVQFIVSPLATLLVLKGHTKVQSFAIWIEFAFFVAFIALLIPGYGLLGLAVARLAASVVNIIVIVFLAKKYCSINVLEVVISIARPLLGSLFMGFMVFEFVSASQNSIYFQVFVGAGLGAVFYSFWTCLTWMLLKKPEGLESTVYDFLKQYRKNIFS